MDFVVKVGGQAQIDITGIASHGQPALSRQRIFEFRGSFAERGIGLGNAPESSENRRSSAFSATYAMKTDKLRRQCGDVLSYMTRAAEHR